MPYNPHLGLSFRHRFRLPAAPPGLADMLAFQLHLAATPEGSLVANRHIHVGLNQSAAHQIIPGSAHINRRRRQSQRQTFPFTASSQSGFL